MKKIIYIVIVVTLLIVGYFLIQKGNSAKNGDDQGLVPPALPE